MALKSPLMPSPTGSGLSSAFSPYTDSPGSPLPQAGFHRPEKRSSGQNSDTLAPPTSPYPQQVDPSPVDSNGTDGTESTDIDEAAQENTQEEEHNTTGNAEIESPAVDNISPQSTESDRAVRIDTQILPRDISESPENAPQSVIHAPVGFKGFEEANAYFHHPGATNRSTNTVVSPSVESPSTPEAIPRTPDDTRDASIPPMGAELPPPMDRSTPLARTTAEPEQDTVRIDKRRSVLHDIPEGQDKESQDSPDGIGTDLSLANAKDALDGAEHEVAALRTALSECWTLCNTLASLSSSYRQRTFQFAGQQQVQEHAWRTCWRLCQELYTSRDQYDASQAMVTLELCREFCQALFDARQKVDEAADSVLRVSFELNNHLYNTHDTSLPEAFNERTLDFYITLCHRLMKQRTSLPQETDALLRACWSLAEMLFNLRQSNREGKKPDEELLGSAVQSCWELCDLFREGWTQIRPDRGTPRPSQTTFGYGGSVKASSVRSGARSKTSMSSRPFVEERPLPPETPTTIFDDTTTAASSPDSASVPNILVLGPSNPNNTSSSSSSISSNNAWNTDSHHDRWTSNASVLSYTSTNSSQHTSSTATAEHEQAHLTRLRCLLLKAGMNTGYDRTSGQQLTAHVSKLPNTAFGTLPWQMKVLTYYKKLVLGDKSMLSVHTMPSRRLGAPEVAKSVKWLGDGATWAWMRDLFRLVFGFGIEEVERKMGSIQI